MPDDPGSTRGDELISAESGHAQNTTAQAFELERQTLQALRQAANRTIRHDVGFILGACGDFILERFFAYLAAHSSGDALAVLHIADTLSIGVLLVTAFTVFTHVVLQALFFLRTEWREGNKEPAEGRMKDSHACRAALSVY